MNALQLSLIVTHSPSSIFFKYYSTFNLRSYIILSLRIVVMIQSEHIKSRFAGTRRFQGEYIDDRYILSKRPKHQHQWAILNSQLTMSNEYEAAGGC